MDASPWCIPVCLQLAIAVAVARIGCFQVSRHVFTLAKTCIEEQVCQTLKECKALGFILLGLGKPMRGVGSSWELSVKVWKHI